MNIVGQQYFLMLF